MAGRPPVARGAPSLSALFVWRRRPAVPRAAVPSCPLRPWPARRLARPGPGLSLSVCLSGCPVRSARPQPPSAPAGATVAGGLRPGSRVGVSTWVSQCQWSRVVSCVSRMRRLGRRVCRRSRPVWGKRRFLRRSSPGEEKALQPELLLPHGHPQVSRCEDAIARVPAPRCPRGRRSLARESALPCSGAPEVYRLYLLI